MSRGTSSAGHHAVAHFEFSVQRHPVPFAVLEHFRTLLNTVLVATYFANGGDTTVPAYTSVAVSMRQRTTVTTVGCLRRESQITFIDARYFEELRRPRTNVRTLFA